MEISAKYKGYCNRCHYTVWQGETVGCKERFDILTVPQHSRTSHRECSTSVTSESTETSGRRRSARPSSAGKRQGPAPEPRPPDGGMKRFPLQGEVRIGPQGRPARSAGEKNGRR